MTLSKQYLQIRDKIQTIETFIDDQKEQLMKKLESKIKILDRLKEEEVDVKLTLIDEMKSNNIKTQEEGDKMITRKIKTTLKLENEEVFHNEMTNKADLFKKLLSDKGITKNEQLIDFLMPRKFDNKNVIELVDRHLKVEGKIPGGIQQHITEYLTVRSKSDTYGE